MRVYRTRKRGSRLKRQDTAIILFDEQLTISSVERDLPQRQLGGRWDNARRGAVFKKKRISHMIFLLRFN
jgi:hypothetical protein